MTFHAVYNTDLKHSMLPQQIRRMYHYTLMITPSSSDYTCAQVYVKDGKRRISSIRITSTNNILVIDNNRDNTARFKINTNK